MAFKNTRTRALLPDSNLSLFKFKLSWLDEHKPCEINIQTWYSYDYSSERDLFPKGLDQQLRVQWKKLLGICWKHAPLYEFVKWLRPHSAQGKLGLYLPDWPQLTGMIPELENKGLWQALESACQSCGFSAVALRTVSRSHPRQPSHSPGRMDFSQFYGFNYVQRNNFIVSGLTSGKLLKIDIYDNLMYHSENHLHSILSRQLAVAT